MTTDEFATFVLARSRWHAWLYRWCARLAKVALICSLVVFCVSLVQPCADLWHQRWAGLFRYATQTTLMVVPILGLSWIGWLICHHIYVRYQPPNNALQRTEAGRRASSEFQP